MRVTECILGTGLQHTEGFMASKAFSAERQMRAPAKKQRYAKMKQTMQLITETLRLKLIKVTDYDSDLIFLLTGNEKVMEYFPNVLSYEETQQMVQKILHQYAEYDYCFWKILLKPDDEFVGIAGLLHQEIDNEAETEISYRMLPEHWNKGYATEAAKACKEYAENILEKNRLISLIHPQNHASIRVANKLGANRAKSVVFIGEEHDVYVYQPRRIAQPASPLDGKKAPPVTGALILPLITRFFKSRKLI